VFSNLVNRRVLCHTPGRVMGLHENSSFSFFLCPFILELCFLLKRILRFLYMIFISCGAHKNNTTGRSWAGPSSNPALFLSVPCTLSSRRPLSRFGFGLMLPSFLYRTVHLPCRSGFERDYDISDFPPTCIYSRPPTLSKRWCHRFHPTPLCGPPNLRFTP